MRTLLLALALAAFTQAQATPPPIEGPRETPRNLSGHRILPLVVPAFSQAQVAPLPIAGPQETPLAVSRRREPVQPPVFIEAATLDVKIDGPVARVSVQLTLRNTAGSEREFDLIFPLGSGTVIDALDLKLDGKPVEGRVLPADKARSVYQAIVRQRLDPGLLEHYGEALFRARVFPVPGNGTSQATLSYTRTIEPEGDLSRLHLPLTAFRQGGRPLSALVVKGELLSDHPVTTFYSPTVDIGSYRTDELAGTPKRYRTLFGAELQGHVADLDFVLYYRARSGHPLVDVAVLSERPHAQEDGYVLAVINGLPEKDAEPEPRDVVFVLDRSGSMQGAKIEQAKNALKFIVQRLRPQDRFNLVVYSAGVQIFEAGLLTADAATIARTLAFIDGIEANGGTNIAEALPMALGLLQASTRVNQVVFLTDGLPTVGERDTRKLARMIKDANKAGARIIAFGVGFDVNGTFLDRIAVQNRGLSEYVLPTDDLEAKVPGFYSRMQSPLVLDTRIELVGGGVHDVYPREIGDLYGGHQILIAGRYAKPGKSELVISGRRGGEPFELRVPVDLAPGARIGDQEVVARLWAARKVGYLVDEIRLNGESKEVVDEIVRLGTRFGILTEYTSFLAAEGTDLLAIEANGRRAGLELLDRAADESGSHGVAQAANSKSRQRAQVAETQNRWYDEQGRPTVVAGVQCVNGKSLFRRGDGWLDAVVPEGIQAKDVTLFSEPFFSMLDAHPWLNRVVSRTGALICEVDGEYVRFLQPSGD